MLNERAWVNHVKMGQLDEGYRVFLSSHPYFSITRNITFRYILSSLSALIVFWVTRNRQSIEFSDESVDLSDEFLIFWKSPDTIGRMLLIKICKAYINSGKLPGRALIWFAHWLVFQGRYKEACVLFRSINVKTVKNSRVHGELLSMIGNYFHSRNNPESSIRFHKKAQAVLKNNDDKFFQMFNLGTSAKTYAEIGDIDSFNSNILANFDNLNPIEPDERYGMRLLIYGSYLHFVSGDLYLGKQFYASAEMSFLKSGSPLDKSIYCIYKSVILLFFRDLDGARTSINEARSYLNEYGYYDSYSKLIDVITNHLYKGNSSHRILQNLLKVDTSTEKSELESWYRQFFTTVLPIVENFENEDLKTVIYNLEKATNAKIEVSEIDNSVSPDDIKGVSVTVSDLNQNVTNFELQIFHKNKLYDLTLSTQFRKWRNPEIFEAIRSALCLLQNMSKQGYLRSLAIMHGQKLKEIEVARRIAHDIKSPLAALQIALKEVQMTSENLSIIKSSTQRIDDIANSLTRKYEFEHRNKKSRVLVKAFIDILISSKRFEFRDVDAQIDVEYLNGSSASYLDIHESEMSRTISNIINNAVESYPAQKAIVKVTVDILGSLISIVVKDFGCGINLADIDKIFEKDVSINKSGSGLGLYYAKRYLDSELGGIRVLSEISKGTSVLVSYPIALPPAWISTLLFTNQYKKIIVVDDFIPNIEMIKAKISNSCHGREIISFTSLIELENFLSSGNYEDNLFVIDYDFTTDTRTGLDIILKWDLSSRSVLATNHYETEEVINLCTANKVKIIPKIVFADILIVDKRAEIFIVDDEKYFLSALKNKLQEKFNIHTFESSVGLFDKISQVNGPSFFFVDRNIKGITEGEQILDLLKDNGKCHLFNISEDLDFFHPQAIKLKKNEIINFLN